MTSVAASSPSSSPSPPSSSSSSIVVLHVDTSDMRPILKEAFGKNAEIATISNNGSIPAKYLYEGLQNYTEGIVANHGGGGGDDDEDAQRTADGVTAIKKNIGIILKEILNDNLRTALTPFDRDGDGTIDAEELQQAAKDHQTVLMSRKILAWFSFALLLFMIIVCGGLSVGIYYIVFSMKDTYVNPSTGLMMVKAPDGSTDSNTAGIFELPTRTLGQGVTITSQGMMDGRTCYSSDSVANMFVNVATGVTTSLAETNQETDELHIYHLGNSDCDESNIVWSNKDVQLGCVVMVPSLECTNMVRRGRYLSEFADTDTDAMQDRHRSLKEHVANMIVGDAAGGQHGTTIDRNNRNLEENELAYTNANDNGSEPSTVTCDDSEAVLYKTKKWPARKCDYISKLSTKKMKEKCKKNTNPNRGKIYDLCRKTCATVGLGPCKAPKPTQPPTLNPTPEPTVAPTENPTTNPTPVPTFAPVPLVTSTLVTTVINPKGIFCSDSGSSEEHRGDCSATPTYCGRDRYGPQPPGHKPQPPPQDPPILDDFWNDSRESCNACGGFWPTTQPANCHDRYSQDLTRCGTRIRKLGDNVVNCRYEPPRLFEENIPVEYSDEARTCYKRSSYQWMGQNLPTRCSPGVSDEIPRWCQSNYLGRFGGYRGSCSGTDNCLNLDFHCAEGEYCEMSCTGRNSCEGLTMYCAANQVCVLQCGSYFGDSCVNAEVKCGEGTVAQSDGDSQGCVLADTADDCDKPILPLYTKSPTSTPTTSPTDPFILTPTITYTCVGVTCSDGFDGSTCGSDGGCCPFGDTPSDGQCSCGTSWSDANVNKIPCKLTQQQPEPES